MRTSRLLLGLMAALLCAVMLGGCGKKVWPEPQTSQDTFAIENATATLKNGCVTVKADVTGNWRKVAAVYLEVSSADCPGCPFTPERRIEFTRASKDMTLSGGSLTLRACGLGDQPLLWRVTADNVHTSIRGTSTKVQMVP
ncbi:lipoprotein [Desulfobaculum senezii]|jgi:hypothetical protein